MTLFNADDVAQAISSTWGAVPLTRGFSAPCHTSLVTTFEAAFTASLATEEGRPLRFRLIMLQSDAVDEGVVVTRFCQPREVSAGEVRRLAPAAGLESTLIALDIQDSKVQVWGIIDVGSQWAGYRKGERSSGVSLPLGLVVTVTGPGNLEIAFSDFPMLRTEQAVFQPSRLNVLRFGPIHDFFRPAVDALLADSFPSRGVPLDDAPFVASYGGQYFRFLAMSLRLAENFAHGGMLAVVRESAVSCHLSNLLEIKYSTVPPAIWNVLTQNVHRTFEEIEAAKTLGDQASIERTRFEQWWTARRELDDAAHDLLDISRHLARLTQVDGALVLTDKLNLLGFGAAVRDLSSTPSVVRLCRTESTRHSTRVASDSFGLRHRSTFSLCRNLDCVAFVLSQDGGIKAVRRVDEEVCLWPSVDVGPGAWSLSPTDVVPDLRQKYLDREPS